jgi:hypothetical protein
MGLQVLTADDLEKYRVQLLSDIENLLNTKKPKKWLRTQEVMDLLGISEATLQTLRNSAEEIDEYLTNKNYTTL